MRADGAVDVRGCLLRGNADPIADSQARDVERERGGPDDEDAGGQRRGSERMNQLKAEIVNVGIVIVTVSPSIVVESSPSIWYPPAAGSGVVKPRSASTS